MVANASLYFDEEVVAIGESDVDNKLGFFPTLVRFYFDVADSVSTVWSNEELKHVAWSADQSARNQGQCSAQISITYPTFTSSSYTAQYCEADFKFPHLPITDCLRIRAIAPWSDPSFDLHIGFLPTSVEPFPINHPGC